VLVLGPYDPDRPLGLDARRLNLTDAAAPQSADPAGPPGHTLRAWSAAVGSGRPDSAGVLHVPALEPADERMLREGLLPASTPAGRALGWLARDLCGLKVGLALGAGSVRGYAHYGVLRAFERIGLVPDYITGTSIGAIIASTYALGQTAEEATRVMEATSRRAFRLTAPIHSLLSNAGVAANFRDVGGDALIQDLPVPLALVAADLTSGREVVLRRGLLRVAALASMAIPGIYPPVRIGDRVLVDGGVVNPVPISVATAMGADVVIATSLGRPAMQPESDVEAVEGKGRLPTLVSTITRSVEVMQARIGASAVADADVLIEADFSGVPTVGLQSFARGRPYIAPGEAAAEAALPAIAERLPWLRGG
jgi:NTE family protein